MNAIFYLKEKCRMTNECSIICANCPLSLANNKHDIGCVDLEANYPEEAVAIVEAWSKANPPMTKKEKFFEMCPDAPKHSNGYPFAVPYHVGLCKGRDDCPSCEHYCLSNECCWDLALDE